MPIWFFLYWKQNFSIIFFSANVNPVLTIVWTRVLAQLAIIIIPAAFVQLAAQPSSR